MAAMRGRDVVLEVLRTEGVTHLFGNPGTTELPLMDALADAPDLHYVLALQEATAVGMADGYAQVTHRPAFLNLHTSAGLGNAIGNLTNAQANSTPLVVTAGQQDRRHLHHDPLLSGDLVSLARPVSKWAREVATVDELATILRRAFQDAASAPAGPVFASLPMDLFDEEVSAPMPMPSTIDRRSVAGGLDQLAALLAEIRPGRLGLVLGDEVSASGATQAAVAVAEALGAPVHGSPLHSNNVFPPLHPLWRGSLPPAAAAIRAALEGYDRVLLVGGRALMVYPYTPGSPIPSGTELLHLSPDAGTIGRAHPVTFGTVGDSRASLEALLPLLAGRVDSDAAGAALEAARANRTADIESRDEAARGRYDQVPMHPMAAAHALLRALPADTPVVDEAITTGSYVRGFHHPTRADRYFFCRGGGLGWGMPAALGVSLGLDRHPVLCVVGDGSAMYSPQALWTAAHEQLPVVFAVVDNQQYLILKQSHRSMGTESGRSGRFIGLDLDQPPLDFVSLAASMGVDATRVERAVDVDEAVRSAWDAGGPHLLHIPIATPS